MHSSSSGPLTTLLMLVPLIAVPALAIFGVPNVDGLNGSTDNSASAPSKDDDLDAPADKPSRAVIDDDEDLGEGFIPTGEGSTNDPFLNGKEGGRRLDRSADASESDPLPGLERSRSRAPRSSANTPTETPKPNRGEASAPRAELNSDLDDEIPFGNPPPRNEAPAAPRPRGSRATQPRETAPRDLDDARTAAPRDWQAATARLKQFGIRDFQLTNGEGDHAFLFTCRYIMPDNPRVVRRFEAESSEPLAAVEDVLTQVETWLSTR